MTKIKFSPDALSDLEQIKRYITLELCNEQAAIKVISNITKKIHILETFPLSGAQLSSIINIETNYRFLVCENYNVFYNFKNDIIYIIRILYNRRNFMEILF